MCLYPKLIRNPKYKDNKKNGGVIPPVNDMRVLSVPIGCGKCMECEKKKKSEWKVRLMEDIKVNKNGKFITLTFSNENYTKLRNECKKEGYELDNEIATLAVRRFLERWRKKYKKSLRHWLVTELGQINTEHIHLHGIVWTDDLDDVNKIWGYGYTWLGDRKNEKLINYVSEKTVNYIVKYLTKKDILHKEYKSIMLTSAGIGSNYVNGYNVKRNRFNKEETKETYKSSEGFEMNLPIYWRNKIYTDEQREELWINKLNQNIRYVNGVKIDVSRGYDEYFKALEIARKKNIELGYGTDEKDWERIEYENKIRELKQNERLKKASPLLTLGA